MGLSDLQSHIMQNIPDATAVVDLLKIARERPKREGRMKLVVDGECCLDRLYGGYYPDWVCGGQWDKMEQFLRNFSIVVQNSNLDLVFFFNGTLEHEHLGTGAAHRYEETYRYLEEISKHIAHKKKPPPKVWWIPPAYLRSALRQTFRLLDMKTMCTLDDHHKDIIRFCQRNKFHGIIAENPEYLIFDSYRYFSAQKLKLTFKGSLETVEVKLKKVFETLNVPKDRIFVFSALLGNHMLSDEDLKGFFASLDIENDPQSKSSVIEKVAQFTRELDTKDLEKIGATVATKSLKPEESEGGKEKSQVIAAKIVKCLRYYADLKAPSPTSKSRAKKSKKEKQAQKNQTSKTSATPAVQPEKDKSQDSVKPVPAASIKADENEDKGATVAPSASTANQQKTTAVVNGSDTEGSGQTKQSTVAKLIYRVNPQVEEVAITRHKAGVMSPYICQIIRQKEIRLPLLIEDIRPGSTELVRAHDLFRPLRQRVYAVLFNLHHLNFLAKQRSEKGPTIQVRETFFCTRTKTVKSQLVNAVEIGWPIPTVEKLWLGEGDECKNKRIRAFLTMMKSEHRMMVDSEFVPQQMVILAAVLRYILQSDKKILRKQELDAFVAQAFIQDMTDANLAQDIEVTNLTIRGVHLSHLFMEGVEMALLANDACGAPLPYMLFCPWLFFNGKIFNYVLEQQAEGRGLGEICGYKADLLYSIEQLSVAICDGVKNPFIQTVQLPFPSKGLGAGLINSLLPRGPQSRVPNVNFQNQHSLYGSGRQSGGNAFLAQFSTPNVVPRTRGSYPHYSAGSGQLVSNGAYQYAGSLLGSGGQSFYTTQGGAGFVPRGLTSLYNNSDLIAGIPARQRRVPTRGGQLEVAGMVVGSWGANYGPGGHIAGASLGHRINRNSVLSAAAQNSQIASLMHPLRISGANVGKASNNRVGHPVGNHWAQKRGNRAGKKSIMKKPSEGAAKQGTAKGQVAANSSGGTSKSKGVSFKDESKNSTADKAEIGAGDAPAAESVILPTSEDEASKINESSPAAEISNGDSCSPSKAVEQESEG